MISDTLGAASATTISSHEAHISDQKYYQRISENLPEFKTAIKTHKADHGIVYELHRKHSDSKAFLLETEWGAHRRFGLQAILLDVISQIFDIPYLEGSRS